MVHLWGGRSLHFDNVRVADLKQESTRSDLAGPCWNSNGSRVRLDPSRIVSSYRLVYWYDYSGTTLELDSRDGRHQHRHRRERAASEKNQNEVGAGATGSGGLTW